MKTYLIQTDNYWCAFDLGDPKGGKSVGVISRVDEKTGITDVMSTLDEHGVGFIAELVDKLEAAEKRIANLEAREVKVLLPESFYPDGDIDCPLVINEHEVIEALVAADCKPVAVCKRCKSELDLSYRHDGSHYCHVTGKGE